jgi:hypothetical protein
LSCEREHIRYYLEEVIGMEDVTMTQVIIFEALSPIWKGMVLEKLYDELNWKKEMCLYNIMKIDHELKIYNEGVEGQHLMAGSENPEQIRAVKAAKQEMIDKPKRKYPTYKFKRRAENKKENIHQILKKEYEKNAMNKFIVRNERKATQARKCVEKRKGPKSKIIVDPTNIKGYKWNFDREDRDKEFREEVMGETMTWVENMQINLRDIIPNDKIKLLYDK